MCLYRFYIYINSLISVFFVLFHTNCFEVVRLFYETWQAQGQTSGTTNQNGTVYITKARNVQHLTCRQECLNGSLRTESESKRTYDETTTSSSVSTLLSFRYLNFFLFSSNIFAVVKTEAAKM